MSKDEIAHEPVALGRGLRPNGAAMWPSSEHGLPERAVHVELAQSDVTITIYGDRWHKARNGRN